MAKFVIEGTVFELEATGKNYIFKLRATEEYSINHDDKKFNILFRKGFGDALSESNKKYVSSYILSQKRKFKADKKQSCLLTSALCNGKRVRICVRKSVINSDTNTLSVSSITLLAD